MVAMQNCFLPDGRQMILCRLAPRSGSLRQKWGSSEKFVFFGQTRWLRARIRLNSRNPLVLRHIGPRRSLRAAPCPGRLGCPLPQPCPFPPSATATPPGRLSSALLLPCIWLVSPRNSREFLGATRWQQGSNKAPTSQQPGRNAAGLRAGSGFFAAYSGIALAKSSIA